MRRGFTAAGGNQLKTARLFGISRNTLRTQLKRFGLITAAPDAAEIPAQEIPFDLSSSRLLSM